MEGSQRTGHGEPSPWQMACTQGGQCGTLWPAQSRWSRKNPKWVERAADRDLALSPEMQLPSPCYPGTAWVGPRKHHGRGSGVTGQPAGTPVGPGRPAAGWRTGVAHRAARAWSHSHLQGQKSGEDCSPRLVENNHSGSRDPGRDNKEKTEASLSGS